MIRTEKHDNWDLASTLIKSTEDDVIRILVDVNTWKTVDDWYIDFATGMINIKFKEDDESEPAAMFRLSDKFTVEITTSSRRHRRIKHKRFLLIKKNK